MTKRKKYDLNKPRTKELIDEIVHGTFVRQGTMVAFPLAFPAVTLPIPPDESRITALHVCPDGTVYGGTTGHASHLFVAMFHGVTGIVYDMGRLETANHCAAICCDHEKFAAFVNGPAGGRVVTRKLEEKPFDLIQEWNFERIPFDQTKEIVPTENIVHALIDDAHKIVIGTTENHLFKFDMETASAQVLSEIHSQGQLASTDKGNVIGSDENNTLWHYDTKTAQLKRNAIKLPKGNWNPAALNWTKDDNTGQLYTTDAQGNIFAFTEKNGFSDPLAQTPLTPANAMAITFDGRLFGFCGEGIANLFCYDPTENKIEDLGAAVSLLERRRYGYEFATAKTGRDGQIYFGENDNASHLWIYFPKIKNHRK